MVGDEMLSIERLKTSFVFHLWSETKLSIMVGYSTLVEFFDQVGLVEEGVDFCTSCFVYLVLCVCVQF